MIILKTYNKSQLKSLINSADFLGFSFSPISFHRGTSQMNNPRATENDTLLILAFKDEKIAGYLGILPDDIFEKNKKIHCGWLSTLFIDPKFRGKKIAQKFLEKAFSEYEGQILITEFTPEAENLYHKTQQFDVQKTLKGMGFYYLFNFKKVLPSKNTDWKKFLAVLKLIDFSSNLVLKTFYNLKNINSKKMISYSKLDQETRVFIERNHKQNIFNRGLSEIEWITENPWILNGENKTLNYQFSAFDQNFEFLFLKIYTGTKLSNVLFLSVRNKTLKLQRVFGEDFKVCVEYLHQYILKNHIINFICFDENINSLMSQKYSIFKKERYRKFMMHKSLKEKLSEDFYFNVSAGDSDSIFT
jgi:GNAT superfamily N-acetyltransferase